MSDSKIVDLAITEYNSCFNHHHEQTKTRQTHLNFLLVGWLAILAITLSANAGSGISAVLIFFHLIWALLVYIIVKNTRIMQQDDLLTIRQIRQWMYDHYNEAYEFMFPKDYEFDRKNERGNISAKFVIIILVIFLADVLILSIQLSPPLYIPATLPISLILGVSFVWWLFSKYLNVLANNIDVYSKKRREFLEKQELPSPDCAVAAQD
jgi:hypothetical protein